MNPENKPVEKPTTETPAATAPTKTKKRSGWLPVFVLLGVFLVGFVPMWLKATRLNGELFRAQQQVRVRILQITFADATIDARRGEHEPTRQRLANFFTLVNAELDRGIGSALPATASEGLKPLLAQRDDLITLLARGDQASRRTIGERVC